jgi:type II secretory pathway pseudopilin PulG
MRAHCGGAIRQEGRTLIELLIAMALSLVIVAAVGSLYYFTSQSARVSQNSSSAEERGRVAIFLLADPVSMAGYGPITSADLSTRYGLTPMAGPHLRACSNGRFADVANLDFTCVASADPGDALFVAFQAESTGVSAPQGSAPLGDCAGGVAPFVPAAGGVPTVRNAYSIATMQSGALEFGCLGNGTPAWTPLVRGVEDFKVYFAFDTEGYNLAGVRPKTLTPKPSAFMTAAQLNALPVVQNSDPSSSASDAWNHVIAVLVCVQVITAEVGTTVGGVYTFQPCPQNEVEAATGAAALTVSDGLSRRTITQFISLRSRTQAHAGSTP